MKIASMNKSAFSAVNCMGNTQSIPLLGENFFSESYATCVLLVISLPPLNSICSVFDCNNCNNINFTFKQL